MSRLDNTILSTTIQNQSVTRSFDSMKLSPNDWIMSPDFYPICCIYFYNIEQWPYYRNKPNDEFMNVHRLMSSLSKLLEYYPLLAGIIKTEETDTTTFIAFDEDTSGVLFISISVNISLCQLSVNEYTSTMSFPQSLQLTNKTNVRALFHVRHMRFTCGGVALTIQLNHCIGDAHSYFQLIKDWAHMYRDSEYQPIVCHQRSLLHPTKADIEAHKQSSPNFNHQNTFMVRKDVCTQVEKTVQSVVKIFRFSADELERMKKEATAQLPSDVSYISMFDALTAHLYRHVTLARSSSHSLITKLYISTDIRSRLQQPRIPSTYFGNAVLYSYLESESAELIRINELAFWAAKVHHAIAAKTSEDILTTLAWISCQPNKSKIVPTCNPNTTDFLITAWNKLGMYSDSDFEHDVHPCRITLPLVETLNGAAILCSTEKNDSSIDVILGLDIDAMKELEDNPNFRKYR